MEIQFDLSQPEYIQSAHSDSRPRNPTGVAAANPLVLLAVGAALGWALSFAVADGTAARPVDVVAASTSTLLDAAALPELARGGSVYRSQVPDSPITLSSDLDAYAPGGSVYRSQVAGPRSLSSVTRAAPAIGGSRPVRNGSAERALRRPRA